MNRRSLFKKLGIGIGAVVIPAPAEPPKDVRPCEKCGLPDVEPICVVEEYQNATLQNGSLGLGHGRMYTEHYLCDKCNLRRIRHSRNGLDRTSPLREFIIQNA